MMKINQGREKEKPFLKKSSVEEWGNNCCVRIECVKLKNQVYKKNKTSEAVSPLSCIQGYDPPTKKPLAVTMLTVFIFIDYRLNRTFNWNHIET